MAKLDVLLDSVVNVIAISLSLGDAFLPSPSDYDDLFYKIIETGDVLVNFRDTCTSFLSFFSFDARQTDFVSSLGHTYLFSLVLNFIDVGTCFTDSLLNVDGRNEQ